MDYGLSDQQRRIVRRARRKRLRGASQWLIRPPLWTIVALTLLPLLLLHHPVRFLLLALIPPLGLWQRARIEQRITEWALDLREV